MDITLLGIDLAKNVFQLHGVDSAGKAILKKKKSRTELVKFIANLTPCTIGMEACATAHYWSRKFKTFGHEVKLINPAFVMPFVKSNKNDQNDAAAITEAMSRPSMRFVPTKSVEQQDILALHRIREQIIGNRTALVNQLRGLLAEFGIIIPVGIQNISKELPTILDDTTNELSDYARTLFRDLYDEFVHLEERLIKYDTMNAELYKADKNCQRIADIPGIGMLTATALVAAMGDPSMFDKSRSFAAWLGLVPRQASSGGKTILLGISKRGDRYLRKIMIHGARAVIARAGSKDDKKSIWITQLVERRGYNKAVVAVANKNARTAWALLNSNMDYKCAA